MDGDEDRRLHQLLQLKRAERPAPEFWADFDRRLRGRCLQELVRPTWQSRVAGICGRLVRLPGVAAVVTVGLVFSPFFHFPAADPIADWSAGEYVCRVLNGVTVGKKFVESEMDQARPNISYVLHEMQLGSGPRLTAYDF